MELYGVLSYGGKEYPFALNDHIVNIVGKPLEFIEDFKDVDEIETISGVTSGNRDILLLHCKFPKNSFGFNFRFNTTFSIQGYALSDNNMGDPCDFTFERCCFAADAINAFFSPKRAIKANIDPQKWDGKIEVSLSPFDTTARSFEYKEAKCVLSISRRIVQTRNDPSIGTVNTIFSFEYQDTQPFLKIVENYLTLYDFLRFTGNSANVVFSDVYISKRGENEKFRKSATVHIFSDKTSDKRDELNSITIDDLPDEKLGDVFTHIADLRGRDKRLEYYFPKDAHEARYIDPGRWMIMALNFEGLFSETFPDFKYNSNKDFRSAKDLALKKIDDDSEKDTLSKNARKYYKKCREQIEHYDGLLEEKFNYLLNSHKNVIKKILENNYSRFGTPENINYGYEYASYRNKIAHGSVEPLTDKEVAIYRLLPPMIYLLLLNNLNLNDADLGKIIDKLFS